MQFKHPELLYALFLLVIPIIVHLFQLRKFKSEAFTNVAFLKKINIQTRKSNTIKKWLVLFTRMSLFACIILAFAQPFFKQSETATKEKETIIYVDNSFSMQAKGPSGQLLKTAVQDLIINVPEEQRFTLITNNATFKNTSISAIRNELLQLDYTPNQLSLEAIQLKAQKEFSNNPETAKRLVYISDFQDKGKSIPDKVEGIEFNYVQLSSVQDNNISIDTLFISNSKTNSLELTIQLSALQRIKTSTSVSLYDGEKLLAKGSALLEDKLTQTLEFDINSQFINEGRVLIEDPLLGFDNTMYFTINKNKPIRVLAVNGGNSSYLKRIFTAPEFDFTAININQLDYSSISKYNYIVLNEVENIPSALINSLNAIAKAGNISTIVLDSKSDLSAIKKSLQGLGVFRVIKKNSSKRLVTNINYNHPIYNQVFDTRIKNFQYPIVTTSIDISGGDTVLKFEDGSNFIIENNGIYLITAALNTENSNFKNSPLIVPTFYNMATESLKLPELYYYASRETSYDLPLLLENDKIVSLQHVTNSQNSIIPLQKSEGSKVKITTSEEITTAGIYDVILDGKSIQKVSYNYPRDESVLSYLDLDKSLNYSTSVPALFKELKSIDNVQSLWKWFIIFALFFLLLEILILKYHK